MIRHALLALAIATACVCGAPIQTPEEADVAPSRSPRSSLRDPLSAVTDTTATFKGLGDWASQAELIDRFANRLWKENNWDSEPDQFGLKIVQDISQIPPWQIHERISRITELVSDRYTLDVQQQSRFRAQVYREMIGLFAKNAGVIAEQVRTFVDSRANGRPLTAEDIEQWTKDSGPLFEDVMERMDRINDNLARTLGEKERRQLEIDRASLKKRTDYLFRKREEWARGEWKPEDWGLENDPIQQGLGQSDAEQHSMLPQGNGTPASSHNRDSSKKGVAAHILSIWDSPWRKYVRTFITTHDLDTGQRDAIFSILSELELRSRQYKERHMAALNEVEVSDRGTHPAYAPLRAMSEELRTRSKALLTDVQLARIAQSRLDESEADQPEADRPEAVRPEADRLGN